MAKKNPYVFTIGFDETDPVHVRAAEILNGTKKKAQLIAAAILSYVDGADSERRPDFNMESFQPLLEKLIQKELERVMSRHPAPPADEEGQSSESILDLSYEEKETKMDENVTRNIIEAMDIFRKN